MSKSPEPTVCRVLLVHGTGAAREDDVGDAWWQRGSAFDDFLRREIGATADDPAARKAYAGLVDEFVSVHADGSFPLTNVVEVGGLGYGRDGSYRYYMSERVIDNDPKGVGPAIMAGLQVAKLAKSQP